MSRGPRPQRGAGRPRAFGLPERGDRQLAFLTAVISTVQTSTTRQRWETGWEILAKAVAAGVPDVAARAAYDLAALRDTEWPAPTVVGVFADVLHASGLLTPAGR
ncbi:hypothetical protein [Streptomyces sp. CA-210063]|uniref:hypothetical protein n=1 Tax=Streptomyces sp. CA-210063 TaxID=2801029 RepID=UPI0027D45F6D|nr:hypothetical protein [Streptomyces sp. CA-210063]